MIKLNGLVASLLTFLFLINTSHLQGQERKQIPGTNVSIVMTKNYEMEESSAIIKGLKYSMTFLEMANISFYDEFQGVESLVSKYKKEGMTLKKALKGKIGNYDALLLSLESTPLVYQVILGDETFCVAINTVADENVEEINEEEVNTFLSTIQYQASTVSPLEEHAYFTFDEEGSNWKFTTYQSNIFFFEKKETNNAIMMMQLPPETLQAISKKELANEFVSKHKSGMPNMKIVEEKDYSIAGLKGYSIFLDTKEDGNGNVEFIHIITFGNEKSAFAFQGIGEKNDAATKSLFNEFIENLNLKK